MRSIWEMDEPRVRFDTLRENKNTDVLIIGGGIAGLLCAYKLKNAGVDCMLVEATEICDGMSFCDTMYLLWTKVQFFPYFFSC